MNKETLQETADRLKNFQGNVRGEALRNHAEYIKSKEGAEGLKRVEEKMAELGAPIDIEKLEPLEWISEGLHSLVIIISKEIFGWSDEDIFEMGRFLPTSSAISKNTTQSHFPSLEKIEENANNYRKKHFDFGLLEVKELNKEKKFIVFREKGFKTHPVVCTMHAGYFKGVIEMVIRSKDVTVKQTASVHEGEDYNEYLVKWN